MGSMSVITFLAALIPSVSAQLAPELIPASGYVGSCNFIDGDIHFDCVPVYLAYLIQMIFGMLGTICLLMIIWAGYEWAFSALKGDSQQAKARLRNAIFGLIFSVLSYLMVDTILSVLLG